MNGLYFIINPAAGHGRAINVWKKVKRELERKKSHIDRSIRNTLVMQKFLLDKLQLYKIII